MSAKDIPALLPCPFCGGAGDIESQPSFDQAANTYERHRGWCDQCGFGLDWHNYEPGAVAAWNTRATPKHPHTPEVAGLVERIDAFLKPIAEMQWRREKPDLETFVFEDWQDEAIGLRNIIASQAADALTRLSSQGEWMPIESAPKDGSNILIIAGTAYSPQARVGWWDNGWRFYSRPSKPSAGGVTVMIEATHWRPLPTPPKGSPDAG